MIPRTWRVALGAGVALAAAALVGAEEEHEPAEVLLGERLFLETRFSQHFADRAGSDVNASVPGDPVMDRTATTRGSLPGPFAGEAMNCRTCHLVDEHRGRRRGGVRAYADFARRSPVPARGDGLATTLRNAPSLVDASRALRADAPLLHLDGEFATPEDLVVGTFTGRNFGWLPEGRAGAIRHIARVLRRDDGRGALARESGGPYARLLEGTDPGIPAEFRLPRAFRVVPADASDAELVQAAARLVGAYLRSLHFRRDSSYDAFLRLNDLPRAPREGEDDAAYADRLRAAVAALERPGFLAHGEPLLLHGRERRFGPRELAGLRVFLARPADAPGATSGVGNCATCHVPPLFTDRGFHNTGVSQQEYDGVHGDGAFLGLPIPDLAAREAARQSQGSGYSPPPPGLRPFAAIPVAGEPDRVDLGLWNVFGNGDSPAPQDSIRALLSGRFGALPDQDLLDRCVAAFKTPSLRDLGQSGPYMHDGSLERVPDAVRHYVTTSGLARAGGLRNPDPEIAAIRITEAEVLALAAFLRSLDEDYE